MSKLASLFVAVLLALAVGQASGQVTGVGGCTSGACCTAGNECDPVVDSLTSTDRTTEPGNRIWLLDNATAFTNDPTCANSGQANVYTVIDSDESATLRWDVCSGTSLLWRWPATSTTTTHFLAATATAGAGVYRAIANGDLPSGATLDTEVTTRCESFTILDPADADDHFFRKAKFTETVTSIDCMAEGGGTISLTLQECSSTGGSCGSTEAAITCDSDGAAHASSIDDASVDAGDWQRALYGAPSGTVNALTFTVCTTDDVVR